MRICWELFAYEAILAAVFFFALFVIEQQMEYTYNSNIYKNIVALYPVMAVTQIALLGLILPVRTGSAISGEKERQTFDIMMTTCMTPLSVACGKVCSAVIQSLFFVAAGLPILALAFVLGGLPWINLFAFLGVALLVALFSASIGVFCSSVCRRTITAVIMAYGFYALFFVATALPIYVQLILYSRTNTDFLCLFNPAVYLLEFFTYTMSGNSAISDVTLLPFQNTMMLTTAQEHAIWMTCSTLAFLLVSVCFVLLAARRINPLAGHSRKTGRKHG